MENAKELVEEFEKEHGEEVKELRRQEQEEEEKEFKIGRASCRERVFGRV